jgi:thiamine pyrophosphate-dependent acetolactate synthase large subunit-like protein
VDVAINVGNKLQHGSPSLIVGRDIKFIDMRIDSNSMGNVITTDVPLVADVAYGMDDLITAVESLMTPKLREKAKERIEQTRAFGEKARRLNALVTKNPYWDQSPMLAGRVTYELTQFADDDAIIVDETESAGPKHMFGFNPLGGREYIRSHYGHLGSGVGTAAGVKLARPDQQVICMTGDGGFIFGPTALWNMARLELPVIVVVYNNHAYSGPHNRAFSNLPDGRMVETGHFVHDYLGNPDMDMAYIAKGFGVDGEVVESPDQLKEALARARKSTRDGKPYLIDAQVARPSTLWADKPWTPPISGAKMRTRKV